MHPGNGKRVSELSADPGKDLEMKEAGFLARLFHYCAFLRESSNSRLLNHGCKPLPRNSSLRLLAGLIRN